MSENLLLKKVSPDGEGFLKCIRREGTPDRVYFIELFLDKEIEDEVCRMYNLNQGLDQCDPYFELKRQIKLQRFLGYDYVLAGVENLAIEWIRQTVEDSADLKRNGGREFIDEHKGPVTSWEEFKRFPWPDTERVTTRALEWYSKHLPEDMIIIGGLTGHVAEAFMWLMGYETLCIALYEERDLVKAIHKKIVEINTAYVKSLLRFDRVKIIWGSDDMGFKTGPLLSPKDLREFVLPVHKRLAKMAHDSGRLYFLHSCGKLDLIMNDLIFDVGIDAKHSFEDTIEDICEAKEGYGKNIALLGGIDVDFLCRANEEQIRSRVRHTLERCFPKGRFCLGTGNSVANYIPIKNYLIMLDEGRQWNI